MYKKYLSNCINIRNNDQTCDHILACVQIKNKQQLLAFMYIIILLFVLIVDVTILPDKEMSKGGGKGWKPKGHKPKGGDQLLDKQPDKQPNPEPQPQPRRSRCQHTHRGKV